MQTYPGVSIGKGVLVCGSGGMEIGHILPVLPRHTHLTSLSAES